MKCPNCGAEIAEGSKFCENCGTKIKSSKKTWIICAVIALCAVVGGLIYYFSASGNSHKTKGAAVYSYIEHNSQGDVKSYFVFTSSSEVVWLLETPYKNVFPVGVGEYNPNTEEAIFYSDNPLHERIMIYYGIESVIFHIDRENETARLVSGNLSKFYNNGSPFSLKRESDIYIPNSDLVGTIWRKEGSQEEIFFKTKYEAVWRGEGWQSSKLYVCVGNLLSIKSGDNLGDENMIGKVKKDVATLCEEGLDNERTGKCITIVKK